jgi:hypothetical protein
LRKWEVVRGSDIVGDWLAHARTWEKLVFERFLEIKTNVASLPAGV